MKRILGVLLAMSLSACAPQRDYAYYMEHPQDLLQAYAVCEQRHGQVPGCDEVLRALKDFEGLLNRAARDGQDFGRDIINAQLKIATLRAQLKNADVEQQMEIHETIAREERVVRQYLAVVRVITEEVLKD